jgi:hypothetical protein
VLLLWGRGWASARLRTLLSHWLFGLLSDINQYCIVCITSCSCNVASGSRGRSCRGCGCGCWHLLVLLCLALKAGQFLLALLQ